ncbi:MULTISPECIES: hypothetical protein [Paraburkholderia]|uniref:Uncharacterized protein n=1 Tax=Paraburkholderia megapolitana TaxID=420953 RepID=A0A1I3ITX2_9BURK|nr:MULTISPECIES: hypothetical protein [Paraburkholderia]MCX4160999.1 hypothetical protein [Paraburkholderia megapolitana]MDN7156495.1 hypothetical protein [Paraburkholderia sp. CHISQ3]MDQ6493540.1 hypothetical protein [Paraburkholderia megapolitana]QDQ85053.1 hypothetical protein FNZ07_28900 [Paraburkholderia megapolitana]SFI51327.1 hypothetical protein SAMN05192543_103413 [Paraburkholderia megapolitana]
MYSPKAGAAVGQMFFAGFGTLWMIDWCLQRHGADLPTLTLIALAGSTIFLWAWCEFRQGKTEAEVRVESSRYRASQRAFRWVNATQWLAVLVANIALNATGHAEWVMPTVILIVGVHFIPLARVFHARRHYATGAALIVVALGYPWIANSGSSYPTGAFATGSILWISALYGFLRNRSGGITARLVERNRLT